MKRILVSLACLVLPLSGCAGFDNEAVTPGQDGLSGQPGPDGTPAPTKDSRTRQVILDEDFTIGGTERTGTIPVQVPEGAGSLFLALEYVHGAYQDPAFTLGECQGVSPASGTHASVAGASAGAGTFSRDVVYGCGALPAGWHEVAWSLPNGALAGHITVSADVRM